MQLVLPQAQEIDFVQDSHATAGLQAQTVVQESDILQPTSENVSGEVEGNVIPVEQNILEAQVRSIVRAIDSLPVLCKGGAHHVAVVTHHSKVVLQKQTVFDMPIVGVEIHSVIIAEENRSLDFKDGASPPDGFIVLHEETVLDSCRQLVVL